MLDSQGLLLIDARIGALERQERSAGAICFGKGSFAEPVRDKEPSSG